MIDSNSSGTRPGVSAPDQPTYFKTVSKDTGHVRGIIFAVRNISAFFEGSFVGNWINNEWSRYKA